LIVFSASLAGNGAKNLDLSQAPDFFCLRDAGQRNNPARAFIGNQDMIGIQQKD
jgi:hypothetical protein